MDHTYCHYLFSYCHYIHLVITSKASLINLMRQDFRGVTVSLTPAGVCVRACVEEPPPNFQLCHSHNWCRVTSVLVNLFRMTIVLEVLAL